MGKFHSATARTLRIEGQTVKPNCLSPFSHGLSAHSGLRITLIHLMLTELVGIDHLVMVDIHIPE